MPHGFQGNFVQEFFIDVNEALDTASQVHSRNPFEGETDTENPPPRMAPAVNQRSPFAVESATSGGHSLGVGNSSNIVVDQNVYTSFSRQLSTVDDRAGEAVFMAVSAIEEMCRTSFVVPETVPRVLEITNQIKNALVQFRSLGEETSIQARSFAGEMADNDGGNANRLVLSESGSSQAISQVSNVMHRQSESMENTQRSLVTNAESLAQESVRQQERAVSLEAEADAADAAGLS